MQAGNASRVVRWSARAAVVVATLASLMTQAAFASGCTDRIRAAQVSEQAGNLDEAAATLEAADADIDCATAVKAARRETSLRLWNAFVAERPEISDAGIPQRTAQILRFHKYYKAYVTLGDHYVTRKQYRLALEAYLNGMKSAEGDRHEPGESVDADLIGRIQSRYDSALALGLASGDYVADGGETTRMVRIWGRGVDVVDEANAGSAPRPQSVNAPVEFEFNSDRPTAKGSVILQGLVEGILLDRPARVHLVGHTDKVGWKADPKSQIELSRRRAAVVERRLRDRGFSGQIRIEGVGFQRPPARSGVTSNIRDDEYDQICRRVEWVPE